MVEAAGDHRVRRFFDGRVRDCCHWFGRHPLVKTSFARVRSAGHHPQHVARCQDSDQVPEFDNEGGSDFRLAQLLGNLAVVFSGSTAMKVRVMTSPAQSRSP
jgi:hypothetical protein